MYSGLVLVKSARTNVPFKETMQLKIGSKLGIIIFG
jgi:hypothetical protein